MTISALQRPKPKEEPLTCFLQLLKEQQYLLKLWVLPWPYFSLAVASVELEQQPGRCAGIYLNNDVESFN